MDYVQSLLQKIREIKESKKLTNEDIAEMTNLPTTTVARMFSGATKDPRFENIVRVAIALEVSVDRILGLAMPNEDPPKKVETVIESYADVLKVKDDVLAEKDKRIDELQITYRRLERNNHRLTMVVFVLGTVLAVCFTALLAYFIYDLCNGDIGIIRY